MPLKIRQLAVFRTSHEKNSTPADFGCRHLADTHLRVLRWTGRKESNYHRRFRLQRLVLYTHRCFWENTVIKTEIPGIRKNYKTAGRTGIGAAIQCGGDPYKYYTCYISKRPVVPYHRNQPMGRHLGFSLFYVFGK